MVKVTPGARRWSPTKSTLKSCLISDRRRGDVRELARRAVAAGVDFIQVREKDLSGRALASLVEDVVAIAAFSRTGVLVNDRLDVAMACDAKGVHLPANGLPARAVRSAVPQGFVVGVSTHSLEEAKDAARSGADFILFGPVFETASKRGAAVQGLDALARVVSETKIPVFALGGVRPGRVREIARAGAAGVAAISAFLDPNEAEALLAEIRSLS